MNKKNIPKYFINILKWAVDNADAFSDQFAFFTTPMLCRKWNDWPIIFFITHVYHEMISSIFIGEILRKKLVRGMKS